MQACEKSLKRLGVDMIDFYGVHRVDPTCRSKTPSAHEKTGRAGKCVISCCRSGSQTIRRAHKVHPIAAVETEYSLWSRDVEQTFCRMRELGIGFMAYAPLGRGFLTPP